MIPKATIATPAPARTHIIAHHKDSVQKFPDDFQWHEHLNSGLLLLITSPQKNARLAVTGHRDDSVRPEIWEQALRRFY